MVADAPGHGMQGTGQLPHLALHVGRQPLRRQFARVRVQRVPLRHPPRQPGHRRHHPVRDVVGQPRCAIHRQQDQQYRHHPEPERQVLRLRAQEHQVQAPGGLVVHQHQFVGVADLVEARRQPAQVGGQAQRRLPGLQQVAADIAGVGRRLHRRGLVQLPVVRGLLPEQRVDQAELDHQQHQVAAQQHRKAGQQCLQHESGPDLARQPVQHCGPVVVQCG